MTKKQEGSLFGLTAGWEHRSWYRLYLPIFFYWFWKSIVLWDFMYPYAANPGMPPVKPMQFSKWEILKQLPAQYLPKTLVLEVGEDYEKKVNAFVQELGDAAYIGKPDVGERGASIQVLHGVEGVLHYAQKMSSERVLIQELIELPLELGVFYYRYPDQSTGAITGITIKEFTKVMGDGEKSIRELVDLHERGRLYHHIFEVIHGDNYNDVLADGVEMQLTKIGNHSKGTKFLDYSEINHPDLVGVFDTITGYLDGVYYGRYDIKASSIEELYKGKNIKVLEVNGVQSDPAHVYDPQYSIMTWYKELWKHRTIINTIAEKNLKNKSKPRQNIWHNIFNNK